MNLEMKDALAQFKNWRDSAARLLFTRVEDGKAVTWRCRIGVVRDTSIVLGRIDEIPQTFSIRRLDDADFEYEDPREASPPRGVRLRFVRSMEISWPTGESCLIRELADDIGTTPPIG